jgi:peroxiredoxin
MSLRAPILFSVLLAACGGREGPPPPLVGNPAPAYFAFGSAGDTVRLSDYRGRPVLLNVWATWCGPCREEIPALEALHREFGTRGLQVLGASIDVRSADRDVRRFVSDLGITFTILRDPSDRVSRTFLFAGVPNTVLIDRNGLIARRWIGEFDPLHEDVKAEVRKVLEPGAGS